MLKILGVSKVHKNGTISIPPPARDALNLSPGDYVVWEQIPVRGGLIVVLRKL